MSFWRNESILPNCRVRRWTRQRRWPCWLMPGIRLRRESRTCITRSRGLAPFWSWRRRGFTQLGINMVVRRLSWGKTSMDTWWPARVLRSRIWGTRSCGIFSRGRLCRLPGMGSRRWRLRDARNRFVLSCGYITVTLLLITRGLTWKMPVIVVERLLPNGMMWRWITWREYPIRESVTRLVTRMPVACRTSVRSWSTRRHGPVVLCHRIRRCGIWWPRWNCCLTRHLHGMPGFYF